jgi:hypothetical protein
MNASSPARVSLHTTALSGALAVLRGAFLALILSAALTASPFSAAPPVRAAAFPLTPQEAAESHAAEIVKTSLSLTPSPVPQSADFEVRIIATISSGYHVNAHKTSDEFLIPTTLTLQLPSGITQKEIVYPAGKLKKLAFSDKPVNVYDGVVTLRVRLHAAPDAPLGAASLPVRLRYQACSDTTCLPPVNVPLTASFSIVPPSTTPVH